MAKATPAAPAAPADRPAAAWLEVRINNAAGTAETVNLNDRGATAGGARRFSGKTSDGRSLAFYVNPEGHDCSLWELKKPEGATQAERVRIAALGWREGTFKKTIEKDGVTKEIELNYAFLGNKASGIKVEAHGPKKLATELAGILKQMNQNARTFFDSLPKNDKAVGDPAPAEAPKPRRKP